MSNILKRFLINKKTAGLTLAAVALAFTLVGLGMASAFHWTGASEAKNAISGATTSASTPTVPGSFADLAQRLSPTVVNVKVTKVEKVGSFPMPQLPEGPFGDFFRQFPNMIPQGPESRQTQGTGSGVIISADGYILTKKIKSDPRFNGIPVIMHSSLSGMSNQKLGASVGVDEYVPKFEPLRLSETLA